MSSERAITCPNCGAPIAVKAAGYSVSIGCQHCGALLDVAHPDLTVIEQYEGVMRDLPIPLGQRGTLFENEWEAIGALARSDDGVDWTETLLFNPYLGYRWLVLSEGEWTFGTMLIDQPSDEGDSVTWRGSRYNQHYHPTQTTTAQVVGEFYWRVKSGDTVLATTYSRMGEAISAEWTQDEVNYTQLVPISAAEVKQSFGLPEFGSGAQGLFAAKQDAGAEDASIYRPDTAFDSMGAMAESDLPKMFGLAAATLLLSLLAMIGFGISTATVRSNTQVVVDGAEVSASVGQITINRAYQPVTIEAHASGFENRWIDIDYTLVNRKTQRGYTAYGVVEHYAGSDSDGPWTEGSFVTVTKFSSVPRGSYDIVADVKANSWSGSSYPTSYSTDTQSQDDLSWRDSEQISLDIIASAGGIMWSNLLLELALLMGLPALILWWRHKTDYDD